MVEMPTQSRGGVKGGIPLAGSRGSALCGVWGNAPTVPRATNSKGKANKGAGSEASLPVTLRFLRSAPQAALLTTCPLARPRCWFCRHGMSFLQAEDFASAEATRGLCGRPLDPFAMHAHAQCTPMFLDFDCCRGIRACGRDKGAAMALSLP